MNEEIKKSWKGYFIPILCLSCLLLNCYFILGKYEYRNDIIQINKMAKYCGIKITDNTVEKFRTYWETNTDNSNMTWQKLKPFMEIAPDLFKNIDLDTMAYSYISENYLSETAAQFAVKQYKELDIRIKQINDTNEGAHLFTPANISFFTFLSLYILFITAIETVILSVLQTIRSIHYERNNKTEEIVYTTFKGKQTVICKLFCSIINTIFISTIIFLFTFILLNIVYPITYLLKTPISCGMLDFGGSPCISSWKITLGGYLLIHYLISTSISIIFTLLAFVFAMAIKNTFTTILSIAGIVSMIKIVGMNMPKSTMLYFYEKYNPFDCLMQAGKWFLSSSSFLALPFYEFGTIIIWCIFLGCCSFAVIRRFKQREL